METCETCKHWFKYKGGNLGTCGKVIGKHPMNATNEDKVIQFGADSIIFFARDFGCNQYEAK